MSKRGRRAVLRTAYYPKCDLAGFLWGEKGADRAQPIEQVVLTA